MGRARSGQTRVNELVGQGVQRAVAAVANYVATIAELASEVWGFQTGLTTVTCIFAHL